MKKISFSLLFILICLTGKASLSIEGFYQGKNLYVQSALCDDGFGYCATKVSVNGNIVPSHLNKGAFEINFSNFNMKIGEKLFVVIEHNEGCKPKIINPEVLLPSSTFKVEEISCNKQGVLNWSTSNESGKLPFQIEQFKWNKWIVIGEVSGEGKKSISNYSFKVIGHSGENKIRVSQTDNTGEKRTSNEVLFIDETISTPKLESKNNFESVIFKANGKLVETKYEIFDAYGNVLKKGLNSEVDLSNLGKGIYYVCYDNKNEKILKK